MGSGHNWDRRGELGITHRGHEGGLAWDPHPRKTHHVIHLEPLYVLPCPPSPSAEGSERPPRGWKQSWTATSSKKIYSTDAIVVAGGATSLLATGGENVLTPTPPLPQPHPNPTPPHPVQPRPTRRRPDPSRPARPNMSDSAALGMQALTLVAVFYLPSQILQGIVSFFATAGNGGDAAVIPLLEYPASNSWIGDVQFCTQPSADRTLLWTSSNDKKCADLASCNCGCSRGRGCSCGCSYG